MSLEFRKIPNQESQKSELLTITLAVQGPEQHPSRPRLVHCSPSTLREIHVQRQGASSENKLYREEISNNLSSHI